MSQTTVVSMKLKDEALHQLQARMQPGQVVLLALNDGSNAYSKMGGTCTIGANFQFVILPERDPAYQIKIENNAGLDLWTSDAEMVFLGSQLVVNARNATLSLSDDSGVIDGAVTIATGHPAAVSATDLRTGKTC